MGAGMDGRDPHGRFKRGWKGGPGRPPRATERTYLATLAAVVTPGKWRAIVKQAAAQARRGDHQARAWLAKYLLGDAPPKLSRLTADDAPPDEDEAEDKGETADAATEDGVDAEAAADAVLRGIWQKADAETMAACREAGLVPADPADPNDDEE